VRNAAIFPGPPQQPGLLETPVFTTRAVKNTAAAIIKCIGNLAPQLIIGVSNTVIILPRLLFNAREAITAGIEREFTEPCRHPPVERAVFQINALFSFLSRLFSPKCAIFLLFYTLYRYNSTNE
jgi:hypothetical protein